MASNRIPLSVSSVYAHTRDDPDDSPPPSAASSMFKSIPPFPALRRIKPLPKRKRVMPGDDGEGAGGTGGSPIGGGMPNPAAIAAALSAAAQQIANSASTGTGARNDFPANADEALQFVSQATPEQLLASAERLSSHMALQGYYLPILNGVQGLFRGVANATAGVNTNTARGENSHGDEGLAAVASAAAALEELDSALNMHSSGFPFLAGSQPHSAGLHPGNPRMQNSVEEDEDADGDYMDHLQNPGNTKKRKVPANISGSHGHNEHRYGRSGTGSSNHSGGEEDPIPSFTERMNLSNGPTHEERGGHTTEGGNPTGSVGGTGPPGSNTASHRLPNVSQTYGWPQPRSGQNGHDVNPFPTSITFPGIRKPRQLSRITSAGLKYKETLRARKRQLASTLQTLAISDTFVLDQALSTNYPFAAAAAKANAAIANAAANAVVKEGRGEKGKGSKVSRLGGGDKSHSRASTTGNVSISQAPKLRLSKRKGPRLARLGRYGLAQRSLDGTNLEEREFTFSCPCASSERAAVTKDEIAVLRERFETELNRQATKAAKLAAAGKLSAAANIVSAAGSGSPLKTGGTNRKKRTATNQGTLTEPGTLGASAATGGTGANTLNPGTGLSSNGGTSPSGTGTPTGNSAKGSGGKKKKKRSALANASNPHHFKNYVPSRLPHTGSAQNSQSTTRDVLMPLAIRFLAADIVPTRAKKSSSKKGASGPGMGQGRENLPQLTNPADEWICAFCEYELFYGDEQDYRRAIRNRKKILKRRRRAQERAAAAASGGGVNTGPGGNNGVKMAEKAAVVEDEDDNLSDEYEEADIGHHASLGGDAGVQTKLNLQFTGNRGAAELGYG